MTNGEEKQASATLNKKKKKNRSNFENGVLFPQTESGFRKPFSSRTRTQF